MVIKTALEQRRAVIGAEVIATGMVNASGAILNWGILSVAGMLIGVI